MFRLAWPRFYSSGLFAATAFAKSCEYPTPCCKLAQGSVRRDQLDSLMLPYDQIILNNQVPLRIGGGIGQSRTLMLLFRNAQMGEVSVTVCPKTHKEICAKKNVFVLE